MNQRTGHALASALVKEGEYDGSLTWPELIGWINRSAAVERLILIATERATNNMFRGQLAEACDKGIKIILQVPEQFTQFGKSVGYVEYTIQTSLHALLPMRLDDDSVEIRTGHTGEFDFRIYPHGAIECPRPNQR